MQTLNCAVYILLFLRNLDKLLLQMLFLKCFQKTKTKYNFLSMYYTIVILSSFSSSVILDRGKIVQVNNWGTIARNIWEQLPWIIFSFLMWSWWRFYLFTLFISIKMVRHVHGWKKFKQYKKGKQWKASSMAS